MPYPQGAQLFIRSPVTDFTGGNKKLRLAANRCTDHMSVEANEWHPPQEGMHSHTTRGPLASLSENVAAIPGGEEVRISHVARLSPRGSVSSRDTFLSSHT